MLRITIQDGEQHYFATVTPQWAQRHDNGALISCGLTVGQDGFTRRMLDDLKRRGRLRAIDAATANHSGCQSSCVMRGGQTCQW